MSDQEERPLKWSERFARGLSTPFDWHALYRLAESGCFRRFPEEVELGPRGFPDRQGIVRVWQKITYVWYRVFIGMRAIVRRWGNSGFFDGEYRGFRYPTYLLFREMFKITTEILNMFPENDIFDLLQLLEGTLGAPWSELEPSQKGQ